VLDPVAEEGKKCTVCVVSLLGSLCPVTLSHIQCFVEARHLLLDQEHGPSPEGYAECIGIVSLNGDYHVEQKMRQKGDALIPAVTRAMLVEKGAGSLPWLGMAVTSRARTELEAMQKEYPNVSFVSVTPHGAPNRRARELCARVKVSLVWKQ
jgi:hypothetical protein